MAEKRAASRSLGSHQLVKRQKSDANLGNGNALVTVPGGAQNGALIQSVARTSGLKAPIMELKGHSKEVYATRFDPTGEHIASGSMDRSILLWNTYGDCENYGILNGHKGAVLDLRWSRDSRALYSASSDQTLQSWDIETGIRIRRHTGHEDVINCMDISKRGDEMLISGSDDCTIGIWDARQRSAVGHIETDFPVTAVTVSEAGNEIYTGSMDNDIKIWDIRTKRSENALLGHADTITSLELSPDHQYLLSYSFDGSVRQWDVRPFAPTDRHVRTYDGAQAATLEKNLMRASWDPKGQKIIASGGGDNSVVIWDANTGNLLYKLPGHKGLVNDVRFSPRVDEPIIVSGSSDKTILLGELSR